MTLILWEAENGELPLTKPLAVNTLLKRLHAQRLMCQRHKTLQHDAKWE